MASFILETALDFIRGWSFSTFFLASFIFLFLRWMVTRIRNFPPGPIGLPVVGYLPFLKGKQTYLHITDLGKKYGNVFSLRLGSRYVVVLNDFKAVKEALSKDAFLGRPPDIQFRTSEITSVAVSNGIAWKEQRRFSLHALRDLGFGKTKMEDHIKEEVNVILEQLAACKGKPEDLRRLLVPSVSNNISALVFGRRFDYNDPKRQFLDERLREALESFQQFSLYTFFPWLKHIVLKLRPGIYKKFLTSIEKLQEFINDEIKTHEETLDENNIRDFIDAFLLEMKKRQNKNDTSETFNMETLVGTVQALFGAGSGTVLATVHWLLLTMAVYRNVQERVQKEIDNVIGRERPPSWSDHTNLPVTRAALMEVYRWQTVAPLSILRYTLEDTTVQGYNIPEGTYVMTNIWAVHHDKAYWKDRELFCPDRFLNQDGTYVEKPEYYIPFSLGKRNCLGETLAEVEVFLYFTSILQRFTIALPEGVKPNFDATFQLTLEPEHNDFCFFPRQ
ncbi:cytochrome P450 2J6-like [Limulus polyphemus]|uniref:Cytochrome P450 2J6-like n=1 Tax=Limulus polyphemus TaxID=6850 RepID=A0ABM1B7L3_LIMPO|nr:cytochrome P450 2J6-like [Limulus polyphemus]